MKKIEAQIGLCLYLNNGSFLVFFFLLLFLLLKTWRQISLPAYPTLKF